AKSKGLQLVFDCPESVPQFIGSDEGKLRQVLINLLGNGLKFTQQGSVTLRVQLDSPALSATMPLRFTVTDTGSGISAADLETIFDPFTQTDVGRQSAEGTGLGLPISRNFVRLMGGDIDITSQLGQGTTVQFQIQASPAAAVHLSSPLPQRVIQIAPNQPTYRILVAEDQPENRLLLVRLLEAVGFEVQAVGNGQDAIVLWREWCPHLIWMDWHMPTMNGLEATQLIRKVEALRTLVENRKKTDPSILIDAESSTFYNLEVPPSHAFAPSTKTVIIALTASIFETTRAETLEAGCDDFVRKPFQAEEIFDRIATHLGVQYVYEALEVVQPQEDSIIHLTEAEQQLSQLPHPCLSDLLKAAIELDEEALPVIIAGIRGTYPRLGQTLTSLADVLEFHKIADLAQQALDHDRKT
ncbi:MAG: ATP-binding protein, partial [Thermosynechococcaceae cyanobacterium]